MNIILEIVWENFFQTICMEVKQYMNFETKNKAYKSIMLIIITALITFIITTTGMHNITNTKTENEDFQANYINISQSAEDITTKIELVKKCLENKYIGELDEENMKEMAIKGYVAGLRR